MPLLVTPRASAAAPLAIELSGVLPERLASMQLDAITRIELLVDGVSRPLGDAFHVSGDCGDGVIECRGDFSRVHGVAAGMTVGTMRVVGGVGRRAAAGMRGGRLEVAGSAGDWLACEMAGGEVHVAGDAGDNLASALPGNAFGMRGGLVIVSGRAGHLAGSRLRRGIVAIGRGCGHAPGFEMRAGTLLVAGGIDDQPGLAMRRGSVISLDAAPRPPSTFRRGAAWAPAFLPLILRRLAAAGFAPAARPRPAAWRQWHGDFLNGGRGELLHPA